MPLQESRIIMGGLISFVVLFLVYGATWKIVKKAKSIAEQTPGLSNQERKRLLYETANKMKNDDLSKNLSFHIFTMTTLIVISCLLLPLLVWIAIRGLERHVLGFDFFSMALYVVILGGFIFLLYFISELKNLIRMKKERT